MGKVTINEKIFVELYNAGKTSDELARIFNCGERTVQRYETRLRKQGKIDYRQSSSQSKEKSKYKHEEVFEEVQVYLDNAKEIYEKYNDLYKTIPLKASWAKDKQTEDLATVWSDMHTGMINHHPLKSNVVTYNEKIQEFELKNYVEGILRFQQLYQPSYNIETFYIFDVGDNITNDRIFEGQLSEITCGVGAQVMKCFQYQSDFIKKMLEVFPRVVMIKLSGNHDRTISKPINEDPRNSFAYLGGQLLKERFRDNKRVEIIVPESYTHTMEIRKHKYLLSHGNSIRGATLNSIERAVKDIANLAYQEFYSLVIIGHFHTSLKLPITPETTLLVNGCWIENDDYAYHRLHKFSTASQYLFNISNKNAYHNIQEIDLLWEK